MKVSPRFAPYIRKLGTLLTFAAIGAMLGLGIAGTIFGLAHYGLLP